MVTTVVVGSIVLLLIVLARPIGLVCLVSGHELQPAGLRDVCRLVTIDYDVVVDMRTPAGRIVPVQTTELTGETVAVRRCERCYIERRV